MLLEFEPVTAAPTLETLASLALFGAFPHAANEKITAPRPAQRMCSTPISILPALALQRDPVRSQSRRARSVATAGVVVTARIQNEQGGQASSAITFEGGVLGPRRSRPWNDHEFPSGPPIAGSSEHRSPIVRDSFDLTRGLQRRAGASRRQRTACRALHTLPLHAVHSWKLHHPLIRSIMLSRQSSLDSCSGLGDSR